MTQPIPVYTEDDLKRVLARDFSMASSTVIQEILDSYGKESWHREILRVRMACVKLANGDISKLKSFVGAACSDYRDVLAWAEYPKYMSASSPEEERRAIETDWNQLQTWLNRTSNVAG